jgi:hypothetical protein
MNSGPIREKGFALTLKFQFIRRPSLLKGHNERHRLAPTSHRVNASASVNGTVLTRM